MLCQETREEPFISVMSLCPATLQMPQRHVKFIRMLCVCQSQFSSDKLRKPSASKMQPPVKKSFCGFSLDGHEDARRATEAGE